MGELRKFVVPEFVFGEGAMYLASQFIMNIGVQKPLIVTDKTIVQTKWYKDLMGDLSEKGIHYELFNDVSVNPRDYECSNGAASYHTLHCDALLAIGGGSVIDCAKGIGILIANGGEMDQYEGVDKFLFQIPPVICIPTTSGSAADVSQFAIITNSKEKYKMAHISKMLVPDVSLLDPKVTLTMSHEVTLDTALDTLAHALESYVSPIASFMTEPLSLSAIERIVKYLPDLHRDLDNLELRTEIMKASLEAGLAFSNASLGLVHALAHSLGGYLDLSHGQLNGRLLSEVVEVNYDSAPKYKRVEEVFVDSFPEMRGLRLYEMIRAFLKKVDILECHYNLVLEGAEIERIAKVALNDPCIFTNPKDMELAEVVGVIEEIFKRRD